MDTEMATAFAKRLDQVKEKGQEVQVGKFLLQQKGYADQFWIYSDGGEGAALGEQSLKELEAIISDFYKRIL